ncbi:hypothetical protein [Shinella fusca]|uniref:Uncharacterized protein n=1 Tax=Shinella fusca TaxID=544480 RepID=A0A7W7YSW5_9HYPH|nr:hypothetical protein [Shinella fusca]MBB5041662.1 hypothetical protein [Shinella fusca]
MPISTVARSLGVALLAATLALGGARDAYSQAAGGPAGGGGTTGGGTTGGGGTTTGGSTPHGTRSLDPNVSGPSDYVTNSIVKNIQAMRAECAGYDPVYRIDCLSQRLHDITVRIPSGPAYGRVREILGRASGNLARIQANNADRTAKRQRSRVNSRLKTAHTYGAVKRQNLKRAMAEAVKVIAEAETQLLRATENSDRRASHYRRIAVALGSTKVLLRSA